MAANLEPVKGPSALILRMYPVASEVCMAGGSGQTMSPDGVMEIMQPLNDYFTPDATDSVYQKNARFLQFKRAT